MTPGVARPDVPCVRTTVEKILTEELMRLARLMRATSFMPLLPDRPMASNVSHGSCPTPFGINTKQRPTMPTRQVLDRVRACASTQSGNRQRGWNFRRDCERTMVEEGSEPKHRVARPVLQDDGVS